MKFGRGLSGFRDMVSGVGLVGVHLAAGKAGQIAYRRPSMGRHR